MSGQICFCKNSCSDASNSVTIQDLMPGEGGSLENGDSAEVKYTGWLLSGNSFGNVSKSQMNTGYSSCLHA